MRILITAGPTREYFDTVRFISNPSTGKMGYALAEVAKKRGHRVDLVSGPVALTQPRGVRTVCVTSAQEMFEQAMRLFEQCDVGIFTAAVCDYRPDRCLVHKLKKQGRVRSVKLIPTRDICAEAGRLKQDRLVVGFAMEDRSPRRNALAKLRRKRCDLVVLNGLGNVGADRASVEIVDSQGDWIGPFRGTKRQLAATILKIVENLKKTSK